LVKLPKIRKKKSEKKEELALPPIDRNKILFAYAMGRLQGIKPELDIRIHVKRSPFVLELPPAPPRRPVIRHEVVVPSFPLVETGQLKVGRIIQKISGPKVKGDDAVIDLGEEGTRLMVIGSTGTGKTNLCKVLIEEYFDNTSVVPFVFDLESEYFLMARPQEDPKLIELLATYNLDPKPYPVRVLTLSPVLKDEAFHSLLKESGAEPYPLKLDPAVFSTDLLQMIVGSGQQKTIICETIMKIYEDMPEKTVDSLIQAVEASEAPKSIQDTVRMFFEVKRDIFGPFNFKPLVENRKINVFWFPAEFFSSERDRVFYAVYFAKFVLYFSTVFGIPSAAVMDEAAEFARGEFLARMVKNQVAGLFRRGRKRRVDSIIATNIGGLLEDIKANIQGAFYLSMPATAFSRSQEAKATIPREFANTITNLPNYHALMYLPRSRESYVIQIRPTRTYLPIRRRKEEERALLFPTA